MRFGKFAVAAGAVIAAACGGGADQGGEAAPPPTPAVSAPTATMAPITGTTHVIQMLGGDAAGFRFSQREIRIKAGDGIRFEAVSGMPHNVAFDATQFASMPAAKAALVANMPEQMSELTGKFLNSPGETYTISFANVPPGKYEANCTPHIAMSMFLTIYVE
jgi:plastocyanin